MVSLPGHGRTASKWLTAAIAGGCLVALAAVACSAGDGKSPTQVSLAQLSANQESYNGKQVATSGTIRQFTDTGGTYYVLEDNAENRVELEPADKAAPYAGQQVTVTGQFRFSQDAGRSIKVTSIEPANP